MSYSVTAGDARKDAGDIVGLWSRHLPLLPYPARNLAWGHVDNPFAPGPIWKLLHDGRCVGVAGLVIRRFSLGGTTMLAGRLGGLAVEPEHRALGPALMLERAVLGGVGANGLGAIYTCSPDQLVRITARAGYVPVVALARYVKVLDLEPAVRRRVPWPGAASWIARPLTLALRVSEGPGWRPAAVAEVDRFDDRFDDLWARAAARYGATSARTSQFLQWRFRDYPVDLRFVTLGVSRSSDGRLAGYGIYFMDDGVAHLADVFAEDPDETLDVVLAGVTRWIRRTGASSISVRCAGAGPLAAALRRRGFHQRPDDHPTTIMTSPAEPGRPSLAAVPASAWHFLGADDFWQ